MSLPSTTRSCFKTRGASAPSPKLTAAAVTKQPAIALKRRRDATQRDLQDAAAAVGTVLVSRGLAVLPLMTAPLAAAIAAAAAPVLTLRGIDTCLVLVPPVARRFAAVAAAAAAAVLV